MLDPAIDEPGKPFSYFWHPTDVIGALYAPVASEVTPEGYLYTGFGELMFFVGNPPEPVERADQDARIKVICPIVQYELRRHGRASTPFTMFAADLGGPLAGCRSTSSRCGWRTRPAEPRAALLSSAYRFSPPAQPPWRRSGRVPLQPAIRPDPEAVHRGPDAVQRRLEVFVRPTARWSATAGSSTRFPRTPEPEQFTPEPGATKASGCIAISPATWQGDRDPKHVLAATTRPWAW